MMPPNACVASCSSAARQLRLLTLTSDPPCSGLRWLKNSTRRTLYGCAWARRSSNACSWPCSRRWCCAPPWSSPWASSSSCSSPAPRAAQPRLCCTGNGCACGTSEFPQPTPLSQAVTCVESASAFSCAVLAVVCNESSLYEYGCFPRTIYCMSTKLDAPCREQSAQRARRLPAGGGGGLSPALTSCRKAPLTYYCIVS
jgi:hypothetical protein